MNFDYCQPETDLIDEYRLTTYAIQKNNQLIKNLIDRYQSKMVGTLKRDKFDTKDFDLVPVFEGKIEQLPRFLRALDYLAEEYEVVKYTNYLVPFLLNVEAKLRGPVAHQIGLGNYATWTTLREKLVTAYDDKRDSITFAEELGVMSQKPSETPLQFYERLILHYDQLLAKLSLECKNDKDVLNNITEFYLNKRVIRRLMNGLREPNKQFLKTRNPRSLEEAHSLLATFAQPDIVELRTRGPSTSNWQNKAPQPAPQNKNYQQNNQKFNQTTPRNFNQNWRQNNNFKQNSNFNPNNKGPEPMSVQTRINQMEGVEIENESEQENPDVEVDFEPVNFQEEASEIETLQNV